MIIHWGGGSGERGTSPTSGRIKIFTVFPKDTILSLMWTSALEKNPVPRTFPFDHPHICEDEAQASYSQHCSSGAQDNHWGWGDKLNKLHVLKHHILRSLERKESSSCTDK